MSTSAGHPGVQGIDASTNFRNTGVLGASSNGDGVTGRSGTTVASSFGDGVFGDSGLQNGVHGEIEGNHSGPVAGVVGEDLTADPAGAGVRGSSTDGAGVSGTSTNANGAQGTSLSAIASGVYGENDATGGYGVAGRNTKDGFGVLAENAGTMYPSLLVIGGPPTSCTCAEVLVQNRVTDTLSLDMNGNLVITGTLTQNAASRIVVPTNRGRKVVSYASHAAQPAIEDFGEAQLVDGRAVVQLDPGFASTIDSHSPYLVFITPDGVTSGGLYVSSKTATSFTVRENGAGRSSIVFDYRIVAKPYGDGAPRLPLYEPPHYAKVRLPAAGRVR